MAPHWTQPRKNPANERAPLSISELIRANRPYRVAPTDVGVALVDAVVRGLMPISITFVAIAPLVCVANESIADEFKQKLPLLARLKYEILETWLNAHGLFWDLMAAEGFVVHLME